MASTSSSLQLAWFSTYQVPPNEDEDDPFSFSSHLPSLELEGKGQAPLDWNHYLPFEQEICNWELSPLNATVHDHDSSSDTASAPLGVVEPLWSMLDYQLNCPTPTPDLIPAGIGETLAYSLEEMGQFAGPAELPSENCRDGGVAATALPRNGEHMAKRPPRECEDGIGIMNAKGLSKKAISRYFYMPITQAAKELNVGLTLLKRRCRELGIRRWPHRKLMSLQTLIKNVQEIGGESESCVGKKNIVVEILEQERKLLEEVPDVQLKEKTKRLRQACFKANYKKRKILGAAAETVV
ncbi:hypothetical protein MLD38_026172 [Melastoma candidum]|uniref:Uncharacterized protein n=1 Tax=Melastoma candidum TaxID=119954 RepID=A0ACB9P0L3_9MYRT|nr:hypothetical protein MLD38_026172 [Melastoma candidum]